MLSALFVWTDSLPNEFFLVICALELCVFEQLLQTVSSVTSPTAAMLVSHFIIIFVATPKFEFWALPISYLIFAQNQFAID